MRETTLFYLVGGQERVRESLNEEITFELGLPEMLTFMVFSGNAKLFNENGT
jgi:hypothetical protein